MLGLTLIHAPEPGSIPVPMIAYWNASLCPQLFIAITSMKSGPGSITPGVSTSMLADVEEPVHPAGRVHW